MSDHKKHVLDFKSQYMQLRVFLTNEIKYLISTKNEITYLINFLLFVIYC